MTDEHEDEVVQFLRKQLEKEEAALVKMSAPVERQREKVRRLRASLSSAQTGTFGSQSTSDHEIVAFLRENASARKPLTTTEIGKGMGIDPRGLSRRTPRMVNDGLIHGSPETGYWADPEDES